ncbi:MAG: DUF2461 domain-containing protein [Saprospiraceae bacterium]
MLKQSSLDFLSELRNHNVKEWFDQNRGRYLDAKADVEQFAAAVLLSLSQVDPDLSLLRAKDCIFRINRDIRFSTDKTPYKNNMGFWMNKGGKKSPTAGYYVQIEPGGKSFIAAGIYSPLPPDLKKVRTEILYGFDAFQSIIQGPIFSTHFPSIEFEGQKTVRVPQGFDPAHPSAEFLKFKSYVGTKPISDSALVSSTAVKHIVEVLGAAAAFVHFINQAFEIN